MILLIVRSLFLTVSITIMREEDVMIPIETIQMWVHLIGNSGFPIAITIYLFMRFEKKIENLEAIILKLLDKREN